MPCVGVVLCGTVCDVVWWCDIPVSQEVFNISIRKLSLKSTILKIVPRFVRDKWLKCTHVSRGDFLYKSMLQRFIKYDNNHIHSRVCIQSETVVDFYHQYNVGWQGVNHLVSAIMYPNGGHDEYLHSNSWIRIHILDKTFSKLFWTWTWTWKMFIRQNSTQHVQEKLTIWMSNTLY